MYVNGIQFMLTMSRHIKFITVEHIANGSNETLFNTVLQTKQVYRRRGFIVDELFFDGEIETLGKRLDYAHISLNHSSENEHVGES